MPNPSSRSVPQMLLVTAAVLAIGCTPGRFLKPETSSTAPVLDPQQQIELQLALGRTYEKQQQWDSARAVYSEVLRSHPQHSQAAHRLAIVYDRRGDTETAAQWFEKALQHDPNSADILCDIGYSHYRRNDMSGAEAHYRRALQLAPQHRRARNQLGLALARSGRRKEALVEFRNAGCTQSEAHSNLAYALVLERQLEDAAAELEVASQSGPDSLDHRSRIEAVAALIARSDASERLAAVARPSGESPSPQEVRPASLVIGASSSTGPAPAPLDR